jgi:preprotein translocase subunit SecA
MVTRAIERAQKQVEAQNFSVRKHLLEYDDVMNKQRENIYALRRQILEGRIQVSDEEDNEEIIGTRDYLMTLAEDLLDELVDTHADPKQDAEEWDLDALKREVERVYGIATDRLSFADLSSNEIRDLLWQTMLASYDEKEKLVGREVLQRIERDVMLQIVDTQWKDHLYSLDHLKEGIGLRGYGQRDPLVEYKRESFQMFQDMKARVDQETVQYLWRLRPMIVNDEAAISRPQPRQRTPLILSGPEAAEPAFAGAARATAPGQSQGSPFAPSRQGAPQPARVGGDDAAVRTIRREEPKVGRNDPCPCGSGKKYKKCHGQAA